MIAYGIMLGLSGIILLLCAAVLELKKRSFSACSEPVTAQVAEKHQRRGKNGVIYELRVAYRIDGNEYKKYLRTTGEEFHRLAEGDPLELLYKPQNPKRVLRPDAMDSRSIRIVLLIGVGLTIIGAALFFIGQS